jgi:glycosyltransferase involved in cell wall biosynthesis
VGIRVAVIDDNPHVRWHGQVYPVNATFHRFLAAFLDLEGSPVASIAHVVPLRDLPDDAPRPQTLPLDSRLDVVGTAPFDGIAGYLRRLPMITAQNVRPLRRAIRAADLIWLKVPASNAPLGAFIAAVNRKPQFGYVAGSSVEVVRAQRRRGFARVIALLVGALYDAAGVAASGTHRVVVGHDMAGNGVVTSLVEADEVRPPAPDWPREPGRLRLAWAGRLADGKGLDTLIESISGSTPASQLNVIGDGPDRDRLVALAASLGVSAKVRWHGYVSDRPTYLELLATADVFVYPSPAEGFPKVVIDAMAVGLPVVASPAGALAALVSADLFEPVGAGDPAALRATLGDLMARPARAAELRSAGRRFAAAHTRSAEAERLVKSWRAAYPSLPWG